MLVIRKSQQEVLCEYRHKAFTVNLLRLFELDYPDTYASLGQKKAEEFVQQTLAAAERYGLRRENAILVYLGLRVEYGEEFQLSPDRDWAIRLLSHPTLPDLLKISMVRDRLRERTQGRQIETIRVAEITPASE